MGGLYMRQCYWLGLGLAVAACSSPSYQPLRFGLFDTGQPALHAVTDTRLRALMNQMNTLMLERFISEPERDREILKDAYKMADAADGLNRSVDTILTRLPALGLSGSEQDTFHALADKLRYQAQQLREQVNNRQIAAFPDTLAQISATCTACHGLFRQLGHREE